MVETGSGGPSPGPAATAVPLLLVVAGVVADGGRGDTGRPSRAAEAARTHPGTAEETP
ncbi:hypothetical protein [Virgisporangium ochraceum]|uniref:Uncharacterized protein n=1 Tax=Virgisporangium ochraceum TaxID=65505 RepID=A0A8J3ZZD3_9ACTN|nr:hypothetical protein [Virgisporangium ochraceum]GIJ72391.1 hypothetical protein Voc01_073080 [Virgisporangium ochraceum]